jgi:hypothetical protein
VNDSAAGPSRLLRGLLAWTALTTVVFWLPTVRGLFDGSSYVWGLGPFEGAGTGGAYWLPVVGSAFALALQWLGWRGARFPFHAMLIGWHLLLFVLVVRAARSAPEDFRLQGDSLGLDVSLVVAAPLLFATSTILSAVWAWRNHRGVDRGPVLPWIRRNTQWVLALLLLLPVQLVLLRIGSPGSVEDALGVVLTILQWMLVGFALRPYPPPGPSALRWPSAG